MPRVYSPTDSPSNDGPVTGGDSVKRLNKFDAERLMNDLDTDPVGALSAALAKVLDQPGGSWASLLAAAPIDERRRSALLACDPHAMDDLARELNELRTFR